MTYSRFSSSTTHLLCQDPGQAFFYDLPCALTDIPHAASDACAHTASTNDLSWSYLPGTTLADFEHELSINYLATQQVYDTRAHTGDPQGASISWSQTLAYPTNTNLSQSNELSHAQHGDTEDAYFSCYASPVDIADSSEPLSTLYAHPSPTHSTYSSIAGALTFREPTENSAIYRAGMQSQLGMRSSSVTSEIESDLCSPILSPSPARTTTQAQSRFESPSPYNSCTPGASTSRDFSPPLPIHSSRRNAPVPSAGVQILAKRGGDPWKCPYCDYVQRSRRTPDLKRHIKTHLHYDHIHDEPEWVCCGIPLAEAREQGLPGGVRTEEPFVYAGVAMVGGCRKVFSRRDALMRHLRQRKGVCYGDANAMFLRGNAKEGGDC